MNRAFPDVRCPTLGAACTGHAEFFRNELKYAAMRPSQPAFADAESVRELWH